MKLSIIDTSDCINDIRQTVEERRLTHLLSMSRWVVLVSMIFGALCAVLGDPQMNDWVFLAWYGVLAVVSMLLWLITYRPVTSIVNLRHTKLQRRFLAYIALLTGLWVAYGWYLGLANPDPEHLFIVNQIQVFYVINCTYFFLNSRSISYGFFLVTMTSPIALFLTLYVLSADSYTRQPGSFLITADYFWLMALLQAFYAFLFYLSIKRMVNELASTVRLRTLYEISNSRLMRINKELESESNTDYLTGVANRRAYENGVKREWKRALRNKTPFTIMVLDIDFFKLFNDRYGHLAGDRALKTVAEALAEQLRRPGDLVARYGGEEFAAVVTGTPLDDCRVLADRVRKSVRNLGLQHEDSTVDSVLTVSIGIAQTEPSNDFSTTELFNQADGALYSAKHSGRNCVVVYDSTLRNCLEQAEAERARKSMRRRRSDQQENKSAPTTAPARPPRT